MTNPAARILLALDAAAHDAAALGMSADIARELDADLTALIVQDVDLLRLARLPFARELGALTAWERPLDPERMEATLRAQALRAEQRLIEALQPRTPRLSLQFARGKIVRAAMAAAAGADFVLFGAARQPRQHPPVSRQDSGRLRIALIVEDRPLPSRPLEVAIQLRRSLGAVLSVLVAGADEEGFLRLRDEVISRCATGAAAARFRRVAGVEHRAVVQAARAERADLVVLPSTASLAQEDSLRAVLGAICCSLLWVR